MRLKQFVLAALCSAALAAPAFAQTAPAPAPAAATAGPKPTVPAAPTPAPKPVTPATATTATPPVASTLTTSLTNINTASAIDLDKLPQIGKARRAAIIKGRPYTTIDDLVTKKVLSKSVFNKIKDKITI